VSAKAWRVAAVISVVSDLLLLQTNSTCTHECCDLGSTAFSEARLYSSPACAYVEGSIGSNRRVIRAVQEPTSLTASPFLNTPGTVISSSTSNPNP